MVFLRESCYAFHMQITIEIPDELAAQAKAHGLTPELYVRNLIDGGLRSDPAPSPSGQNRRWMLLWKSFSAMSAYSDKIPAASGRGIHASESFYQGLA